MSESRYIYVRLRLKLKSASICLLLIFSLWMNATQAQTYETVDSLLEGYAAIILAYESDEEREAPLRSVLTHAERLRSEDTENAAYWIACARIRFAYANTQGPFRGMRLISESREELEKAISLDPLMYEGYAKAYLGYLYAVMPSWPISFGDKDKGRKLLEEALIVNESNIPNNYFYATYLTVVEDYAAADRRLNVAEEAIVSDPLLPRQQELFVQSIKRLRIDIEELANE